MSATVTDYRIKEKISESRNSLVYRAHWGAENQPVILKMPKQGYPTQKKIAAVRREYELTRSLQLEGVVQAYTLTADQYRPVLVLEDFGGESLASILQTRRLPLADVLSLAIQAAEIVGQVHQQHVIHKDVNPSNLVWNSVTGQLKLIDFGIATRLTRENQALRHPSVMEGTLAYMSPEQTGRMNRAVAYHTDFYSLGVTFYELLTGTLPFSTTDALALVHAHIAQQPIPPHTLVPDIPLPLSAIVMKLMAKNAEDRYQSAYGLKADLVECFRQWQETKTIDSFQIGQQDVIDRFHIPQKLYGREREVNTLLTAFARVSQGARELLLVSGHAGIGKSALVQEVYRSMAQQRGYFITGKFDQFQRNIPYASLTQAFCSLVRQILTESEDQIAAWRNALVAAIGLNLQVVIDVIPEVELIVGPQPVAPPRSPTEAQNRFNLVFQKFIRVFTGPGHPLVIFLDDLQWADGASLTLLQLLMTASENHFLFVICAYRDNEVSGGHPMQLVLEAIRKEGGIVTPLVLAPLRLPDVQQLIAETLACPIVTAQPLAEAVLAKTAGNPFFINEFLKSLHGVGLLTFDGQRRAWQWDVGDIKAQNITDNVVELMAERMQKLERETQEALKLAACLGNQFDLHTLAIVREQSPGESATTLWPAMVEGLLIPLGETSPSMDFAVQGASDDVTVEYKFAHDRVQQAAYSLISHAAKPVTHWNVGRLLLQNMPIEEQERNIFDIVNHLNEGRDLVQQLAERETLAALNLKAGKKAKAAAAYASAFGYLQTGTELLPEDAWERQYDLVLALYIEAAEAAYLSGNFLRMEQLTSIILQRSRTLLDKVSAYEVMLHAYSAQNNLVEGMKIGLRVLALLSVPLADEPSQADIVRSLEETQHILAGSRVGELLYLPVMRDPHAVATMRMLSSVLHLSYVAFPKLFPLVVFRMVNLSATHGNIPLSAQAYAAYGFILCGAGGDIETGYQFGDLALNLVERFNARELKASVLYIVNAFVRHWKEHIKETLPSFQEGYQIGLETGDLNFATFNTQGYGFQAFWMGAELAGLERKMAKYNDAVRQLKQGHVLNLNALYRQVFLNLQGQADNPCQLIGESYNEEKVLPLRLQAHDENTICHIHITKLVLCYLFQEFRQAVSYAAIAEKYLDSLVGTAAIPGFHFYDSLARLAVFPNVEEAEQIIILARVAAHQEKMKTWARHAPMNFLHKFHLVEAERARVLGADREARESYDQAIDLAREHGYVNEEALANELAAKFYLARRQTRLTQYYLREAHYAYARWGATAKVNALEAHYPKFLPPSAPDFSLSMASTVSTNASQRLSTTFDFTSVLKASQAISREIVLDRLLMALMGIVIENAGAQRGILLLEKEGRLVIEAEGEIDHDEVAVLQSVPVETSTNLPTTIVRYVERTKEPVVLSEATQETVFANDPYITKQRPRSVLCVPLLKQGTLIGIVYLENNLTPGVFTPDRLEVVTLLSAEAATSIENARLYRSLEETKERLADYSKTLEQKVADRTQQLEEKNQALENANRQVLEANRRKSQFLAGMSHQLRTPMNAILGFTRLVLRRTGDQLPERQRENLGKVKESAENLLVLINDLLDLSKIEAGRMEIHPALFGVPPFIQSCCDSVSPLVKPEVQLRHEITSEVGEAYSDEDGLRQVLLNLLSNALKFTHVGEVVVRVKVKKQHNNDASLVLEVADTGIGIAAEVLPDIFEEFHQGEGGSKKHEGTGLGLPIAKKWVELLGGSIIVESTRGKGSTFTVTVPVIYQKQREPTAESVGV